MRELIQELKHIKVAIFDLDGVVYRGQVLIPNVDNIIQDLKDLSIRVVYNSNNSTITRQMYVERLKRLNIECEYSDFYTSASITSQEITKIKKNANIYVIGENGLKEELKALGHKIIPKPTKSKYNEIDFVIVGLDIHFNYNALAIAQRCILEGNAKFYATNADTTLPVADGLMPGAGVMVNAVTTCTGKAPIKIFGKPQPHGINLIIKEEAIKPNQAIIFGDRVETDILAGNRAGINTAIVLTGVTTKTMMDDLNLNFDSLDKDLIPDFIYNNLDEIFSN
ncbi:MAG: HAD-IIA family hydrolase [Promethearchaeota archaeon]